MWNITPTNGTPGQGWRLMARCSDGNTVQVVAPCAVRLETGRHETLIAVEYDSLTHAPVAVTLVVEAVRVPIEDLDLMGYELPPRVAPPDEVSRDQ